jgi:hypothetical protein
MSAIKGHGQGPAHGSEILCFGRTLHPGDGGRSCGPPERFAIGHEKCALRTQSAQILRDTPRRWRTVRTTELGRGCDAEEDYNGGYKALIAHERSPSATAKWPTNLGVFSDVPAIVLQPSWIEGHQYTAASRLSLADFSWLRAISST